MSGSGILFRIWTSIRFLTFPVVRTTAADGTEIRDYVNGRSVAQCSGGGSVFAGQVSAVTISSAQLGYLLSGIDWRNPQATWRPTSVG